jgi:hypothetical protein
MDKLREMLREMEDNLGIWGDIIGGLCLMLLCYAILMFAVVL